MDCTYIKVLYYCVLGNLTPVAYGGKAVIEEAEDLLVGERSS